MFHLEILPLYWAQNTFQGSLPPPGSYSEHARVKGLGVVLEVCYPTSLSKDSCPQRAYGQPGSALDDICCQHGIGRGNQFQIQEDRASLHISRVILPGTGLPRGVGGVIIPVVTNTVMAPTGPTLPPARCRSETFRLILTWTPTKGAITTPIL